MCACLYRICLLCRSTSTRCIIVNSVKNLTSKYRTILTTFYSTLGRFLTNTKLGFIDTTWRYKHFFVQEQMYFTFQIVFHLLTVESHCNGGKPCNGNGYCRSVNATSYLCVCKLGFKGLHCDTSGKFIYRDFSQSIHFTFWNIYLLIYLFKFLCFFSWHA